MESIPKTIFTFGFTIIFCSCGCYSKDHLYSHKTKEHEAVSVSKHPLLLHINEYTAMLDSMHSASYSQKTCNPDIYDCSEFNEIMLDYMQKLESCYEKIMSRQTLSDSEVEFGIKTANEYYTYLVSKNIGYGRLLKDMLNNQGTFAKLPLIHWKHQAEVEGKSEQIENIINNVHISWVYCDARLRSETKFVSYKAIAKYHYEMFEHQGLSKLAWAGALFEEFGGSGSWMKLSGYDKNVDFLPMHLMKAIILNKESNGVKAREALKSLEHLFSEDLKETLRALLKM